MQRWRLCWLAFAVHALVPVLHGQVSFGGGEPFGVLWVEHSLLVAERPSSVEWEWRFPKAASRQVRLPVRSQAGDKAFSRPTLSAFGSTLYCWAPKRLADGTSGSWSGDLFESADGRTWRHLASWNPPDEREQGVIAGVPRAVFPLEEDRYLCLGVFTIQGGSRPAAPSAIGRIREDGRLRLEDLGDPKVGLRRPPLDPRGAVLSDHFTLTKALTGETAVEAGAFILAYSAHEAVFLVYDRRGQFVRKASLFGEHGDGHASTALHDNIVIGLTPTQDGRVLLATRTQEAVERAQKVFPHHFNLDTFRDPVLSKAYERNVRNAVQAFPGLEWWFFEPATGDFSPADPPQNVPTRFASAADLSIFRFHPKLNGDLEIKGLGFPK